ncbi:hypothetical protein HPP92_004612 [Vanilla planifolia]|uniref:Uncharacterized protein n=1 Tax=Vanilla planifolia TaxID=51239 RepID=A0A835S4R8_VANPL|nr:hypothetical protein HPP92_004612 [Vanilla planifolia]
MTSPFLSLYRSNSAVVSFPSSLPLTRREPLPSLPSLCRFPPLPPHIKLHPSKPPLCNLATMSSFADAEDEGAPQPKGADLPEMARVFGISSRRLPGPAPAWCWLR